MKNVLKKMVQATALAGLTLTLAWAGAPNDVRASIPFAFHIGNTSLPAGEYTVEANHASQVMYIRDETGCVRATFVGMTAAAPAEPNQSKLLFRVYGSRLYLSGIWNGLMGTGETLPKSAAEREMEIASAAPGTRVVLIAQK